MASILEPEIAKLHTIFAQRLRVALAASGVTAADLARDAGVSAQAVSKWTHGRSFPSSDALMSITRFTGCSVEWLVSPEPVDIRSTANAPGGKHIKHLVREVVAESFRLVAERASAETE